MLQNKKPIGTISRMWGDNVSTKFSDSLVELFIYEQNKLVKNQYIHFDKAPMSWHELGRNHLVTNMLGDWLLMLDTDHTFSPDLLERLMTIKNKYELQVISGIYQYKFPPHNPVANMWVEDASGKVGVSPLMEWDRTADIIQVGCVGAGCLLVDRKVYKRIEIELGEAPFSIIPGLSEDYSFCYRCKKLGIPVVLAPQVECHHVIPTVLSIQDYRPDISNLQKL